MHIEYLPWYHPGSQFMRCQSCGALVVEGDIELHTKWHKSAGVWVIPEVVVERALDGSEIRSGMFLTRED